MRRTEVIVHKRTAHHQNQKYMFVCLFVFPPVARKVLFIYLDCVGVFEDIRDFIDNCYFSQITWI